MEYSEFLDPLEELRDCAFCPRNCHADRFSSKKGYCKSGAAFSISSICIHRGEEPVISGTKGICNIFFAHCNLQCIYCQNWQISSNRTGTDRFAMELKDVIREITAILDQGINTVGFVSPSHFIPQVKIIIRIIESKDYKPVWVFNTNGYDRVETLRSLEGLIDVYLPDLKYMDPVISKTYSDASDYPEVAGAALKEMYRQKGAPLFLTEEGTAGSGIIIRHLVLPGQAGNSKKVLRFIAGELSPKLHISLMSQYYPTPAVSCHPSLSLPVSTVEYNEIADEMHKLGMQHGWIQEMDSMHHYRPDFDLDHPFENLSDTETRD